MSSAWEVTDDDIEVVLFAHGINLTEEIADLIDADEVESDVLNYLHFDNQVQAAFSSIENQLFEHGILKGKHRFVNNIDEKLEEDSSKEFEDDEDE